MDNAEYDDAKQDQAFIEGRIQDLERMLATAQIIDEHPAYDCVGSARTSSSRMTTARRRNTSSSARPRPIPATAESPTSCAGGRALLGRAVGDEVTISAPAAASRCGSPASPKPRRAPDSPIPPATSRLAPHAAYAPRDGAGRCVRRSAVRTARSALHPLTIPGLRPHYGLGDSATVRMSGSRSGRIRSADGS